MELLEFGAIIEKVDGINGAYVRIPFDVKAAFGTEGQVKVVAEFDGFRYRGSLAKMGLNCHIIGLTKAVRQAIGKQPGDTVRVTLREDLEPREVETPPDLTAAMATEEEALSFYDTLSYSNKKAFAQWITSSKKETTRADRVVKAVELLRNGVKHP